MFYHLYGTHLFSHHKSEKTSQYPSTFFLRSKSCKQKHTRMKKCIAIELNIIILLRTWLKLLPQKNNENLSRFKSQFQYE